MSGTTRKDVWRQFVIKIVVYTALVALLMYGLYRLWGGDFKQDLVTGAAILTYGYWNAVMWLRRRLNYIKKKESKADLYETDC